MNGSRPTTPQGSMHIGVGSSLNSIPQNYIQTLCPDYDQSPSKDSFINKTICDLNFQMINNFTLPHRFHALSASSNHIPLRSSGEFINNVNTSHGGKDWNNIKTQGISHNLNDRMSAPLAALNSLQSPSNSSISNIKDVKELPTPSSTPTTSRKSRRRSNLFIPSSKKTDVKLSEFQLEKIGIGRAIPLKQGYLYKRSSNSLNKEWKKKYVTLCDNGRLTYHCSLHDYMDDIHGKEIALNCVTVKLPGQKPRGSKSILTNSALTSSVNFYWKATNNVISDGIAGLTLPKDRKNNGKSSIGTNSHTSGDEGVVLSNSNSQTYLASENTNIITKLNESQSSGNATVKKRHRRMKSTGVKNDLDGKFLCNLLSI